MLPVSDSRRFYEISEIASSEKENYIGRDVIKATLQTGDGV